MTGQRSIAPEIRRARSYDIDAVARLFRLVRDTCLPFLPKLHTPEEDLWFFREHVFRMGDVWVAEHRCIAGFCAYRPGWVDHLYVHPEAQGQGIGSCLLSKAMEAHPRLRLWVFRKNLAAVQFYAAKGFRLIEETDGSRNEEHEPDALYEWQRSNG